MPQLDYHKVISIIGRTLDAEADLSVQKTGANTEVFTLQYTNSGGETKTFKMIQGQFRIELQADRSQFDEKKFDRWLSSFEYELEQTFLTNIKVTVEADAGQYRIIISS